MAKIYTKTGDKGETGTFRGRTGKGDQIAVALGSIDELNSWIGLCRSRINSKSEIRRSKQIQNSKIKIQNLETELRRIQGNLMTIGTMIAGYTAKKQVPSNKKQMERLGFDEKETGHLETLIDTLSKELPKLTNFIYPTGVGVAAELQVARSVARRCEREVVSLMSNIQYPISNKQGILSFLNRLSDALFVIARWVNFKQGGDEEVWK